MSTYNAFYVRKKAADDATREAILSLYPKARIEVALEHYGLFTEEAAGAYCCQP